MQKLVWQNSNGDVIDLTSGNYNITNWEGFSNADLNIQSQQVPFQDGGVFLDALIEQRELSVTLAMQDNGNLEERYRMRRELIHALNPKLGEGYLIYTNDFISKRIKCVAQIPLFPTHNSNDSGTPKASLAWTACEPYWEDLEETEAIINAEEITNYPPVIIRIRERKLKEYYLKLKKKEQDLQKREEIVNMKEEEIKKKEKDFVERESEINKKEDNLENKELELHKREMMVEIREKELLEKEESFKQKNNLYNNPASSFNQPIKQNIPFQNIPIGQVNFDFNKLNINKTGNNY